MGNGARYKVQTQYGWFSLDESSYRDYLEGKLWISWPTVSERKPSTPAQQETLPPEVSKKAIELRDSAEKHGMLTAYFEYTGNRITALPYLSRMSNICIDELNLSVRSSNGLMRAGASTLCKLMELISSERGIMSARNLGAKSAKEIISIFLTECYNRLIPYEKAVFWQKLIDEKS